MSKKRRNGAPNGYGELVSARARASDAAASLSRTGERVRTIEALTSRLATGGADQVSAADRIRVAAERAASAIDQLATTVHSNTRTQATIAAAVQETLAGLDSASSGLTEIAASVAGVRRDADVLTASVESTAA